MRYVAKVLGSVLHFKPVIAAVTETELPLLFYGVKHLLPAYSDLPAPDTNVAAVLCDTLVKMKNTVLHQPGRASSLVPPLPHCSGVAISTSLRPKQFVPQR